MTNPPTYLGAIRIDRPAGAHRSETGAFRFLLHDDDGKPFVLDTYGSTLDDSRHEAETYANAGVSDWQPLS